MKPARCGGEVRDDVVPEGTTSSVRVALEPQSVDEIGPPEILHQDDDLLIINKVR
jgi:23S rRNA-/tRNA-specific pseudouridylate synthase